MSDKIYTVTDSKGRKEVKVKGLTRLLEWTDNALKNNTYSNLMIRNDQDGIVLEYDKKRCKRFGKKWVKKPI